MGLAIIVEHKYLWRWVGTYSRYFALSVIALVSTKQNTMDPSNEST